MIEFSQNIFFQWFSWEFFEVPKNILKAWRNYLKFGLNYFSIFLLIKTFFSPWRRLYLPYPKGFDPGRYFETFSSNLISRVLGALLRSFLIILGILFEIFIFFAGFLVFLGWLFLPIFLIWGLGLGLKKIIL